MREVAPGDLILSFVETRIVAVGIAASYCYESPKPAEFGQTGMKLGVGRLACSGKVHPLG
jgi:hypothetical protein